jgi:hypothetical protein
MANFVVELLLVAACAVGQVPSEAIPLTAECEVRFSSPEEGREILTADDAFSASLSRFDLQCRLKSDKDVTLADWKQFTAQQVKAWEPAEVEAVMASLRRLKEKLAPFRLPLPPTIRLIRTTGEEEANAAYTRSSAIALPPKVLKYDSMQLDRLLAHELFHILSRHDGAVRAKIYQIIGFEVCEPIELPASLAPRRVTNPDAPRIDCTISLLGANGKTYVGAPVLYSSTKQYDAKKGATLFQSLLFRLLVVEQQGEKWQPVLVKGEPVVINPREEQAFLDRIGKNTNYIIHPDEIMADNFVRLVMADKDVPTPQIIEQMRSVLTPR